jgi:putative ATPase
LIRKALVDQDVGIRYAGLSLDDDARRLLLNVAQGDARKLLNVLERAAALAVQQADKRISKEIVGNVVRSTPQAGFTVEDHYDLISALQKSIRGSDVDAAMIYLARLLDGGDPMYVARRLVVIAAEDVGMADPQALVIAQAGYTACASVGAPENSLVLANVTFYLASAQKSTIAYQALSNARALVADNPTFAVPLHLRNAPTKLMKEAGYGKG